VPRRGGRGVPRAVRGPDCDPGGFGGRIVVGRDADRRFARYMRRVLGREPPLPPVRHPVVYGGARGADR
jgi:hypothetical protein